MNKTVQNLILQHKDLNYDLLSSESNVLSNLYVTLTKYYQNVSFNKAEMMSCHIYSHLSNF